VKIGILKLGANISWGKNAFSAGNADIHTMCRALSPHFEIHVISGKTRNTKIPSAGKFHNILSVDINSLDLGALLVFNGNVNFFGGSESKEGIFNYVHINKFKGPVFYINTDGQLPFKQIWPSIASKEWAPHWKEEDVVVTRKDIVYITQGRNIPKTKKYYEKQKGIIIPESYQHFPLEKAILINPPKIRHANTRNYELIFGGRVRSSGRRKDLIEFYVKKSDNLRVLLFGGLNKKTLGIPDMPENVKLTGKILNSSFMSKMSQGKATCIIGDPFYHGNFFTLRMYESILSGVVTFIHYKMDPEKEFYHDERLRNFLTVKSGKELTKKMKGITLDDHMELIYMQYQDVVENFNTEQYSQDLNQILRNRIL